MGNADAKGKNNGEGNRAGKKGQTKRDETRETLFFNLYLSPARQDSSGERSAVVHHPYRKKLDRRYKMQQQRRMYTTTLQKYFKQL